jgi:hypothetical protein
LLDMQDLEEFKSKFKFSEGSFSSHGSSKDDFILNATIQDMKSHQVQPKSWIIDTEATNHMTGASNVFTSYTPTSAKDKVWVADGSMAPIT